MSEIRAFPAVRYATTPADRDLSTRLAPPYDVLDGEDKRALLGRDPRNFVKIDLPHVPPKSAGPAEAYTAANEQLEAWLTDGTLVRDAEPAVYVYRQHYQHGGKKYVRKMLFARLRLEPFGSGSVFPHERTFGGPKEDRLCLTKATGANLSPIFGLYQDADNSVAGRLEQALDAEPLAIGTLEGVENRIWAVTDPVAIGEVAELMRPKATYIADGHHRYSTGMMYRDWLVEQEGPLPDDHPANFVLCVLCAMEDPGLLILPTHRVLPGVVVAPDTFDADERVEVVPLEAGEAEEAVQQLAPLAPRAVAVFTAGARGYFAVRPRRAGILDDLEPDHSPAWRALGLAFLHAYLLDRTVTPKLCGGTSPAVRYVKSAGAATAEADQTSGTAFLMQATTMEELRAVCKAGDLMPHKSTYFYPKLASGLVINPLTQ
jgi:uncharacterized protein (DUF1015 family)